MEAPLFDISLLSQESQKQMSFTAGDLINVVVNESKSGWKYGENCRTKQRGWFPETYTMEINTSCDSNL